MEARYAGKGGRRALVARLLRERPWCEACVRIGRTLRSAGGDILDESNVLCVCRVAHRWIHEHPADARAIGLLGSRYARGAA